MRSRLPEQSDYESALRELASAKQVGHLWPELLHECKAAPLHLFARFVYFAIN